MRLRRWLAEGDPGNGLLSYALLLVLVAFVLIVVVGGGTIPTLGIRTPLDDLAGVLRGLVGSLSGLGRETIRPFQFRFRFP